MYIEKLKKEGQAWVGRRRYYNAEDDRLDNEYSKNVSDQKTKISACQSAI